MLKITDAGGVVLPACPAFYSKPQSIDDLVISKGGKRVMDINPNFHAYDVVGKGAVLVLINDPPLRANFIDCDGRIDEPISGLVQLLGFQYDGFYDDLYSSLLKLQK
jgi:hypothetical protein